MIKYWYQSQWLKPHQLAFLVVSGIPFVHCKFIPLKPSYFTKERINFYGRSRCYIMTVHRPTQNNHEISFWLKLCWNNHLAPSFMFPKIEFLKEVHFENSVYSPMCVMEVLKRLTENSF
jgi:hypothetical protein